MGFTRYGKKVPSWQDLSAQDILEKLTEYFLDSGFAGAWGERDFTIDELRAAVLGALQSQSVIPLEELERMLDAQETEEAPLDAIADQLIRRMVDEGYLTVPGGARGDTSTKLPGRARFAVTTKGLDFLGFRALRETLSKAGRASFGRHDTERRGTGVDAVEAARPYQFGDTLNLDASATLLETIRRQGIALPLDLEEQDLRVREAELRVSAATVLMLDCSHSMVLYGEDRFTPAKRVALALAHLIRTQYPGDELSLVLFHDAAEEVPLVKLPHVQVGPYHTNTAAGLALARRILTRTRREMRSIVLITDGKPSALTLPDGRIYTNSFGLDPMILQATFEQVYECRRAGIPIHTFMLARDRALIAFVKKVSEICKGRAYFTSPMTLGSYVTMDFLNRKVETIN